MSPGHSHAHPAASVGRLRLSVAVVLCLAAVEVVVGRLSGSLALTSDAGHMGMDAASLMLALYAVAKAQQPATSRHTFGFHRSGAIVAAVNGSALLVVAVLIAMGAVSRLTHPEPIIAAPVIVTGILALALNLGMARLLAGHAHDLSVRSALLHILADALASVGVIVAAIIVLTTGWQQADAVVSLGIAGLIGAGAVTLLVETVAILTDAVPKGMDAEAVRTLIAATPGVIDVHDLHVWSLDRQHRALSAHVEVADASLSEVTTLLRALERRLCDEYGIEHATLQPECPSCVDDASLYCDLDERHAVHVAGVGTHTHR